MLRRRFRTWDASPVLAHVYAKWEKNHCLTFQKRKKLDLQCLAEYQWILMLEAKLSALCQILLLWWFKFLSDLKSSAARAQEQTHFLFPLLLGLFLLSLIVVVGWLDVLS